MKIKLTLPQVFVCIEDYRLLFSETLHPSTTENAFLSANIGKSCLGYLALTAQSQVFLKYEKTSNSYSSNSLQRYGFQVKENEEIKLTLFAEEESERSLWIEVINEAIAEVEHELSTKALIIPSFATQNYGPMPDSTSQTSTAVDFPHMEGYLRKTSSGKTLGIKSVKKRWFRLEGGELRYYEDEDVRPSKVRGVFELSAIEVLPPEMENSPFVQIQFPDGGRLMKLEAANGKIAHDWRDALNQTIFVLQQNRTIYNSEFKKARRFNVYDHITDEEKKSLKATVAKTFTSTSSPSSPLPSPPPPSSSSPSPARKSFFGSSPTPPAPPSTPSSKNIRRAESNGFESPIKSYYKSPQLVEMLKSCLVQHFLLKDLLNFNPIIDKLQEKIAVPGEVVIWQGSIGDLFYIIEKGSCEVVKDGKRVAVMSEGKSFGEMALLNSAVRQATIRALRTCRFWCLHRKAFREIIAIQEKQKVEERLQFLKGIELFQKFNDGGLEKIADVMTMKSYQPNDKIIRQGEVGDRFYMIASGRVSVTQQSTFSSTVVELVKLGPNKYFGELALIEDSPRKATVTAITAVTCWTVDRKSFLSLFGSMKEALNESVGVRMLKNVKLLNALSEHQLISVARCLENKAFVEGEVIIRQGDVGDCFYMIASGEVSVQVNHVQVAVLEAGTFFGEMSLLSNEKRSATVIALKDTTCLLLSRTNFNEHLGPLDEVIKAESERRQQMLSITQSGRRRASTSDGLLNRLRTISGSWFQTSTSPTNGSPKRDSLLRSNSLFGMTASMFSLSTLDKIKKLGFGTFGTVYLVQHHDTSKYYAMKEIRKEHLFSTDQEKYLYSEKENLLLLLSSSSSSSNNGSIFFPELYSTFHDPKCVYFIEQYFPSGDLWKCLYSNNLGKTKVGGITVEQARFYAANVLGAIQYMHQHDIIHRDLKPENMVRAVADIFDC